MKRKWGPLESVGSTLAHRVDSKEAVIDGGSAMVPKNKTTTISGAAQCADARLSQLINLSNIGETHTVHNCRDPFFFLQEVWV